MRPLALLPPSAWLTVACFSGDASISSAPAIQPEYLVVTGVVTDSLTREPVANAIVAGMDSATTTGLDGAFRVALRKEDDELKVLAYRYQEFRVASQVPPKQHYDIQIIRLVPTLIACRIENDSVRATIVDLQGRKTMNRGNGSIVTLQSPAGSVTLTAWDWVWRAVDPLTWDAIVPAGPGVQSVIWDLCDKDGYAQVFDCSSVPPQPPRRRNPEPA